MRGVDEQALVSAVSQLQRRRLQAQEPQEIRRREGGRMLQESAGGRKQDRKLVKLKEKKEKKKRSRNGARFRGRVLRTPWFFMLELRVKMATESPGGTSCQGGDRRTGTGRRHGLRQASRSSAAHERTGSGAQKPARPEMLVHGKGTVKIYLEPVFRPGPWLFSLPTLARP